MQIVLNKKKFFPKAYNKKQSSPIFLFQLLLLRGNHSNLLAFLQIIFVFLSKIIFCHSLILQSQVLFINLFWNVKIKLYSFSLFPENVASSLILTIQCSYWVSQKVLLSFFCNMENPQRTFWPTQYMMVLVELAFNIYTIQTL